MKTGDIWLIDLEEIKEEKAELEKWSNPLDVPNIDLDQMKYLIDNPPKFCEEIYNCPSYRISGNHCKCIRGIFLHEQHYEYYLSLIRQKIEQGFCELIAKPRSDLD